MAGAVRADRAVLSEAGQWPPAGRGRADGVLQRAERLRQPVPFRFPVGAVIWVNLDRAIAAMIERQLGGSAS